ncbi:MAG TPA: hypothetical protein DD379_13455 [Cyanobacteria bacterium UBA11162]|nr:hypothetical protein [Cyanobacteria bacterium UBA11162]
MISKHLCPCCSLPLLRHISCHRIYWFCNYCHQEMPILDRVVETNWASELGIRQVSEYQRCLSRWWSAEKLGSHLEALDSCDRLTQLANRHGFDLYLDQEWRRMARDQAPLSLILCDIDFFKTYNDTYGQEASDQCLQHVAVAIAAAVKRPADLVAHYEGEKFAIILPNTHAQGAVHVAEQIRSQVSTLKIAQTHSPLSQYLTLSLGVASMIPSYEYSPGMLMTAATQALEGAKVQGRDQVILHEQLLRQTQLVEL